MIRLTRHTDYGIALLTHMAMENDGRVFSARGLADATGLPQAMVGKILNELSRAGVLESQRGAQGGYFLADDPDAIFVDKIIAALEGPIALAECLEETAAICEHADTCCAQSAWRVINNVVKEALSTISLADLIPPAVAAADRKESL